MFVRVLLRLVPNWAETCIVKDMPNLTMQYMADTASIELIRNCQQEGLIRASCKNKNVSIFQYF